MSDQDIHDYLYWCAERYLSYRPRTEFELRRYLKRKLHSRDITDADEQEPFLNTAINKLAEEGYINDEKFLKMFVDDRQYFRPRGKRRLVLELKQKGVAEPLIENYFSDNNIDELPLIANIIQKKFFFLNIKDASELDPKTMKKLTDHLLRRGFSYSDIKLAIEEFDKKK
ncbi:regulatory protein RecX [Candidatus Woesebacteria bacterium]|nr:regulatory protein RecX [Candidatus Woesebacteria bacterium]